jgi:cytochrome P450
MKTTTRFLIPLMGYASTRCGKRAGEENKKIYVSVGKNDLSFGYGRHACPGIYLGHLNIKLILAEILLRYDIKLPPGKRMPQNDEIEAIVSIKPD